MNESTVEHQARCDLAAAHRLAVMDGLNEGHLESFQLDVSSRADPHDGHTGGYSLESSESQ